MGVLHSQLLHSIPSIPISALPSLSALLASIPHLSLPFTPSPAAGGPREGEQLEHSREGNQSLQKVSTHHFCFTDFLSWILLLILVCSV